MIMEGFSGMEEVVDYSIVAHSGDSHEIVLVEHGKAPANEGERMDVLKKMVAHTQYCWSGDNTLPAIREGVRKVVGEGGAGGADEHLVVVVSDANLERYGISPAELRHAMLADPQVQA